jgi:purine-binding chemotaxis protein CheW
MSGAERQGAIDFAELYRRMDEAERVLEHGQAHTAERRRAVLSERARLLAGSRDEVQREQVSVLAFRVGGERYAVPLERVDHVLKSRGLSPLPGVPRHVLGALNSRSRVVPVLDLRQLLGLEGGGMSDLTRVVVVNAGDEPVGIAAEEVEGRLDLARSELGRPPPGPFLYLGPERLTVLAPDELAGPGAAPAAQPD